MNAGPYDCLTEQWMKDYTTVLRESCNVASMLEFSSMCAPKEIILVIIQPS